MERFLLLYISNVPLTLSWGFYCGATTGNATFKKKEKTCVCSSVRFCVYLHVVDMEILLDDRCGLLVQFILV